MLEENPILNKCNEWAEISKTKELLSIENFVLVKNNFHLHFANNFVGDIYREQRAYKKCFKDNPDFCKLAVHLATCSSYSSCLRIALLYEAYKMMHTYAESNWKLFQ